MALGMARTLAAQLAANGLADLYANMELPLVPVLAAMEERGIAIDPGAFRSFLDDVQRELDELTRQVYAEAGDENVFAAEVEEVLKKHKKVNEAVVIGLPDKEWGHRIHAILETNEPTSSKELIKFALDYLPPYKIPKSFEFLDEIPRNDSGKFVRPQLIDRKSVV